MLLLWSCAKVGVPPGGPEDKTGPTILHHVPEADAINVPRKLTARLVFSEPVSRASVEAALFFAPEPGNRLRYAWHGNSLELEYLDSLAADRTYVISVGSSAKDQRGNPVGFTYTMAFSTGAQIDRGRLAGVIADESAAQAVAVWAYALSAGDTVDPALRSPEYRLQAARDGSFRFGYLAQGRYRVFAVQDRNFDGKWQPSTERVGIAPWDVTVTDTVDAWACFKLSRQDTAALRILGVREIDQTRYEVKLGAALDSAQVWQFTQANQLPVTAIAAVVDSGGTDTWQVFTGVPLEPGAWTIRTSDGRLQDTLTVRARPDTSRPRVRETIPLANRPARTLSPFQIEFSEPVLTADGFADSLLIISTKPETLRVVTDFKGSPTAGLTFVAEPPYVEGESYFLRVDGRLIHDVSGNQLADTTVEFRFSYYPADSLGSVAGEIANESGPFLIRLLHAQSRIAVLTERIVASTFRIDRLVPGKYVLEVISDRAPDNPGRFDYGSVYPMVFSEPFSESADTVTIRARWEYETTIPWSIHP